MDVVTQQNRPGRKRSEASRTAILDAAVDLVREVGFGGLTIEGIARRSGAGKQTVYRWWPSKADVLLEAVTSRVRVRLNVPDEGDYASDLRAFLRGSFALGREPGMIEAVCALMAQAQIDPDFARRFRSQFIQHRRESLLTLVRRADARGELHAKVSPDTVVDLILGATWYRVLATDRPLDDTLVEEIVALVTGRP